MSGRIVHAFVIAIVTIAFAPVSGRAQSEATAITDPEAYGVYASVLPQCGGAAPQNRSDSSVRRRASEKCCVVWDRSLGVHWLQSGNRPRPRSRRPTPVNTSCCRCLHTDIGYQLTPRTDIEADDARLTLRYPGMWQRRPESLDFAAVSAVSVSAARDKAIVYVTLRSRGDLVSRELRDGQWRAVADRFDCGWIA
jgi:hypothetical protein